MFSSEVCSFGEGTPAATREAFSKDELAQLRGFPNPARAELIKYFTHATAEKTFVRKFRWAGQRAGRRPVLPWLGFVPDDVAASPRSSPSNQFAINRSVLFKPGVWDGKLSRLVGGDARDWLFVRLVRTIQRRSCWPQLR